MANSNGSGDSTPLPPSLQLKHLHHTSSSSSAEIQNPDLPALTSPSLIPEDSLPTSLLPSPSPSADTSKRAKLSAADLESESAFPALSSSSSQLANKTSIWGSAGYLKVRQAATLIPSGKPPTNTSASVLAPKSSASTQNAGVRLFNTISETFSIAVDNQAKTKEFGSKASSPIDIVRQIMAKTNTQIEMSTSQKTGTTIFIVKGKSEDISKAKREIQSALSKKVALTVQVPASTTPFIIGRKGQTLKSICERTGARINVPNRKSSGDADSLENTTEQELVDLMIEGSIEGAETAKAEIMAIVQEKMSKDTIRLSHIEPQYYPLIAGANNSKLQDIMNETNCKIHLPLHVTESVTDDEEQNGHGSNADIVVTGEKEAVAKTVQIIDDMYEELKRTTRKMTINIPKRQHKYLTGPKGQNLQEILASTGCTVTMSLIDDPSDTVVILGPDSNLVMALGMVMEKANSTIVDALNIVPAHRMIASDPVEHAKHVVCYLINRQKLRKLADDHGVKIIPPSINALSQARNDISIEIVGKDSAAVHAARSGLMTLVKSIPPLLISTCNIEPLLHRHVIGRQGKNLQRMKEQYGVHIVIPDASEDNSEILLVFEGKAGEQPPSDRVERENIIKSRMEVVRDELVRLSSEAADFQVATVKVAAKFHRQIIGPKGTTLNAIVGPEGLVSVRFPTSPKTNANGVNLAGKILNKDEDENMITIKGPKEHVERVKKEIIQLMEETKHADVMASYTVEFRFPSKFSGQVIGRGGANISKLKEQLGVQIDIEDLDSVKGKTPIESKATITGIKKNAEEAKVRILNKVSQLADQTTVRVNVPQEYHASLIGASGKYVRRLEEKYNVRIWFPRNKSADEDAESTAGADNEEDPQKPDEIIIKGGKKGVTGAKGELQELYEYEKEHGHVMRFNISQSTLPHVVGKAGKQIQQLKDDTETRIDISREDVGGGNVEIVIQGKKDNVAQAQKMILAIANDHESKTTITINIDSQFHKYLIGPNGSKLRDIVIKAGGPENRNAQLGMVKFPAPGAGDSLITLSGDPDVIEKIKSRFESIVDDIKAKTTIGFAIPKAQHSTLIGRGGMSLRELQEAHNVEIMFPGSRGYKQATIDELLDPDATSEDIVKIVGRREDCDAAHVAMRKRILPMKLLMVPRKYHAALAQDGSTFRKLRSTYKVIVDHGKIKVPIARESAVKKSGFENSRTQNGNAVPTTRIDDDDDVNDTQPDDAHTGYDWNVYENADLSEGDPAEIPWNFKGEDANLLEKAVKYVKELLEEVAQYTHTGNLSIPPSLHRHVIGRGGATVTKIREETRCKIDVPNAQSSPIIVITGSRKDIESARQLIIAAVEKHSGA